MNCTSLIKNKLSVVIPYYNAHSTIERLLKTIPDVEWIEVLIINDRSDDSSSSFLANLVHDRYHTKLFYQARGKIGAGAARNKGLELLTGQWVIFADSDDFFTPDAFETIKYFLKDLRFDVLYFEPASYKSGAESKRHLPYKKIISRYLETGNRDLLYRYYVPWSKIFNAGFIKDHDIWFDECIASNDIMFSLKSAYLSRKIAVFNDTIYCVVDSNTSLTKTISEEVLDSRFYALARYNKFLTDVGRKDLQRPMFRLICKAHKIGFHKVFQYIYYTKSRGFPIFGSFINIKMYLINRKSDF